MTVREYITGRFPFLMLNDATLVDLGLDLDAEYTSDMQETIEKGMIDIIAFYVLSPKQSNISENGFSLSWDYSDLGKLYLWLCRKWGIEPDEDVLALCGISMIKDISDMWVHKR